MGRRGGQGAHDEDRDAGAADTGSAPAVDPGVDLAGRMLAVDETAG
jgi:hypothetical protein